MPLSCRKRCSKTIISKAFESVLTIHAQTQKPGIFENLFFSSNDLDIGIVSRSVPFNWRLLKADILKVMSRYLMPYIYKSRSNGYFRALRYLNGPWKGAFWRRADGFGKVSTLIYYIWSASSLRISFPEI